MRWTVLVAGGLAALGSCGAAAAPLTCDAFRTRLDGALMVTDGPAPEAPTYRETRTGADGGKRLAWRTPSLDGTMSCGPAGAFRELYVSLTMVSKARLPDQIKRFDAFNGAALCALAEGAPPACVNAGKQLVQIALEQMDAQFRRKAPAPSGLGGNGFAPHLRAEATAAPSLLTFTVGVEGADDLDEARQPLMQLFRPPAP